MKEIHKKFKSLKKSKNIEQINDFLISLGKHPDIQYLEYVDYFFNNADFQVLSQIELNLIYLIGEIGKKNKIENKYIDYLIREYYNSDRWIRNEILLTFNKIATQIELPELFFEIVRYALVDDYSPIKLNALNIIYTFETIPNHLFTNIFKLFQSSESDIMVGLTKVLLKHVKNISLLFNQLNESENYKIFNKKAIRSLLSIFFQSALNIEEIKHFKTLITTSNWDSQYKEDFCYEIEIYEKLLLKML